jgi:membrane protease YdiL (CAAX protease family)
MEIRSYLSSKKTLVVFVLLTFLSIYFSSLIFESNSLAYLQKISHGLIDPNLVVFGFLNLIAIGGLLIKFEKLPLRTLGLTNLKQGVLVLVLVWSFSQLIIISINLILGQAIEFNMIWSKWEPTYIFGFLIAMIIGTAFFEEIAFRGYLLPQFYFLIKKRQRIIWAIVCSSLLFSLFHVPSLLFIVKLSLPSMLSRLLMLFIVGLISCFAYLRTGNIFVLIAIHALNNAPTPLFQSPLNPSMIGVALSITLLIFWPFIFGNGKFMEWYPIKLENRNMENAA